MITQQEMIRRALQIQAECVQRRPDLREKILGIGFKFSTRMTSTAGYAVVKKNLVKLAVPFFADENNFREHFFNTVTHEIAHILAPPTRELGRRKWDLHGLAWKRMHRSLGGNGERCHSMEQLAVGYSKRRTQPEVPMPCYKCGQPLMLKPRRAKMYQAGINAGTMGPGTGYGIRHRICPR